MIHPDDRAKNSLSAILERRPVALPGRVPDRAAERRGALVLRRRHHLARRRRQAGAHERRHRRHHRPQARRGAPGAAGARGRPSRQEHAGGRAVGAAAHRAPDHRRNSSPTVEGRVHALAATHNLLSSTRWEGADLRKIVEEEMAPYHATHRQRVITEGPAVVLLPATAQAVALALHELATNAAKYGALSTDTGTLTRQLDDRRRRPRCSTGSRPAVRRPAEPARWASASPSCAPASRRSSAAASSTTGGPRACVAGFPSRPPRSPSPGPRRGSTAPRRRPTDQPRRSLAGKRLLVVEDELLVSMLLEDILTDLGAERRRPLRPAGRWPGGRQGRALRRRHPRSQSRRRAGRAAGRSPAGARRAVRVHHRLSARQHRPALRQRAGAAQADRCRGARRRAAHPAGRRIA